MRKTLFFVLLFSLILSLFAFTACGRGKNNSSGKESNTESVSGSESIGDTDSGGSESVSDTDSGSGGGEENKQEVDLVLFIGQSNMAGRGNSAEATVVGEGHAYEFRAVSDPTKLYPLTEPFGVNENDLSSGVAESTKTGSLVSAFCESYYTVTQTPIVGVSCSKGGTDLNFWAVGGKAYYDACTRMWLAQSFLQDSSEYSINHTYLVWLQGESDGDNGVSGEEYATSLDGIFRSFKNDIGVEQCFVISIGGYNGTSEELKSNYETIRQSQINYCASGDIATLVSVQLYDMYRLGLMKDTFHYTQTAYEIVGKDAGANAGYFANTGLAPDCKAYEHTPEIELNEGGAWIEKNGKIVINAVSALENSSYANASTAYSGGTYYYWEEYDGYFKGIKNLPNVGGSWTSGNGYFSMAQLSYEVYVSTPGKYFAYFFTSHPDTASNSLLIYSSDATRSYQSDEHFGTGLWHYGQQCFVELKEGYNTITVVPREDGVIINQIMLSLRDNESVEKFTPLTESERQNLTPSGAFEEINGLVCIDTLSALENSEYASATNYGEHFWQKGINGRGIQVMPNSGKMWAETDSDIPKVEFKVNFTQTGMWQFFMKASCPDVSSDSFYLSIDGGEKINTSRPISSGSLNRWLDDPAWQFEIASAGIHTVTLYAREDGANIHKLVLCKDAGLKVAALEPDYSPRQNVPQVISDNYTYLTGANAQFKVMKTGEYNVYALADFTADGLIKVDINGSELSQTATGGYTKLGSINFVAGGINTISCTGVDIKSVYIVNRDYENRTSVETLVFGDSYTNKSFWRDIDAQLSEIGGMTIGISGTIVSDWTYKLSDFCLYNPENIVINIGVNDVNRGIKGDTCGNSIAGLIESIKGVLPQTKIFYISILDNNANPSNHIAYGISNSIVKKYADSTVNVYYIDFSAVQKEHANEWTNNGFLSDNLHPSAQAYEVLSKVVINAVNEAYRLDGVIGEYLDDLYNVYTSYESNRIDEIYNNARAAIEVANSEADVTAIYNKAVDDMANLMSNFTVTVIYCAADGSELYRIVDLYKSGETYSYTSEEYLGLVADKQTVEGSVSGDVVEKVTYTFDGADAYLHDVNGNTLPFGQTVYAFDGSTSTTWDHGGGTYKQYINSSEGFTGDFAISLKLNSKFNQENTQKQTAQASRTTMLYVSDAQSPFSQFRFFITSDLAQSDGGRLGSSTANLSYVSDLLNGDKVIVPEIVKDSDIMLTVVRTGDTLKWQAVIIAGEGSGQYFGNVYKVTCTLTGITAETLQLALSNRAYTQYTVNYAKFATAEETALLTVKYIDVNGNSIANDYKATCLIGDGYALVSPQFLGFTADKESVSGVITEDTTINVIYTVNGSKSYLIDKDGNEIADGTRIEAYSGSDNTDMTARSILEGPYADFKQYVFSKDGIQGDFIMTVHLNTKSYMPVDSRSASLYIADADNSDNYWLFRFVYNNNVAAGDKLGYTGGKINSSTIPNSMVAVDLMKDCDVYLTMQRKGSELTIQTIVIGGKDSGHEGEIYVTSCTNFKGITKDRLVIFLSSRAFAEYTVYGVYTQTGNN